MIAAALTDTLSIAHRGCHAGVPENTLPAFEAAVKLGVDGIETDVRLSGDGRLVLLHDRVTPRGRPVAELTHAELAEDFGHEVPLLADALDAFPDLLWNIEIKVPAAAPAMLAAVAGYRESRRLLVTSFQHDIIADYAERLAVDCGLLFAHRPLDIAALIAGFQRHSRVASLVWDYDAVDDPVLHAAGTAGWRNYVYGAVTAAEHQRCRALRCAGVITDFPWLLSPARPMTRSGGPAVA
ncbi:MAG TPA: glycerophosphodiester phosphodiesterase [Burkholderiales bacterium]|nr:glycerophosphodiester phosphodiesterase [Burkholderiales bacterium]